MEPNLHDIRLAQERLEGSLLPSPLVRSSYLSETLGAEIFLKLENLQETGSFKVRGAYNRLVQLTAEQRTRGVIAASAGNHAQGVAWAARRLGLGGTIVMPEEVSMKKLMVVREYEMEVVLHGANYDEAYAHAVDRARQSGKALIPAFDDPQVIAGQGTIGLEISHLLTVDTAIVVPVGGGGLISGISIAAKAHLPQVRIIGVQANCCPSVIRSLDEKRPVTVPVGLTLADGIAVKRPGDFTFPLIERYVDEMVGVDEEGIAGAIMNLLERMNIVAEGAGVVPLAALMDGKISTTSAKRFILIISGGNIETNLIDRILQKGSVRMGRLIRIQVNLLDIPGSLHALLGVIAQAKANILHIFHDRLALDNPTKVSRVKLNLETRGPEHAFEVLRKLREAGYYEVEEIL